jgi:hypothetical protein
MEDNFSRKIYFHTDTGDMLLKRFHATSIFQTIGAEQTSTGDTISSTVEVQFKKNLPLIFNNKLLPFNPTF